MLCSWSSLVTQQVKDLVLSLLWLGFEPWPRAFYMPQGQSKKKKKKKKKAHQETYKAQQSGEWTSDAM